MKQPICPHSLRWIVAQEGSRQSYGIPLGFHKLEALRLLYVDIWCRWGRGLLRHGPTGARALASRYHEGIPSRKVVSFSPSAILSRTLLHRHRATNTPAQLADAYCRFGRWYATRVRDHLARQALEPGQDCYFGFNTNCLETLELLQTRGVLTVVDQVDPARVEEDLVQEEAERWPDWERVPGRYPGFYWDRLAEEWKLADVVLVNSEWSCEALTQQGVPRHKIIVVPLALDLSMTTPPEPIASWGPLKVLWLGSVILRKGIQYLVEAARQLLATNIEFLIAGPVYLSKHALAAFPPNMRLLGRVTRDQLGEIYRQAHVFVLPTVSDGFAITQLEAMAHGLPVVTTPNCGRVVTDGVDGFVVPARDSEALASALAHLDADRALLKDLSEAALRTIHRYDVPSNAEMINRLVLQQRVDHKFPAPPTMLDLRGGAARADSLHHPSLDRRP